MTLCWMCCRSANSVSYCSSHSRIRSRMHCRRPFSSIKAVYVNRLVASGCRRSTTKSERWGVNQCCSRRVIITCRGDFSTSTGLLVFQNCRHCNQCHEKQASGMPRQPHFAACKADLGVDPATAELGGENGVVRQMHAWQHRPVTQPMLLAVHGLKRLACRGASASSPARVGRHTLVLVVRLVPGVVHARYVGPLLKHQLQQRRPCRCVTVAAVVLASDRKSECRPQRRTSAPQAHAAAPPRGSPARQRRRLYWHRLQST